MKSVVATHQRAATQLLEVMKSICDASGKYNAATLDQRTEFMPRLNLATKGGEVIIIETNVDGDRELGYQFFEPGDTSQIEHIDGHFRQAYITAIRLGVVICFREGVAPIDHARPSKKARAQS